MRIYLKGGTGFLGKTIYNYLNQFHDVIILNKKNYKRYFKLKCDVFINCSTNSKKYLSSFKNDYDFKNTVLNTFHSIKNYQFNKYLLISSCEVYDNVINNKKNHEKVIIDINKLSSYGLNKFFAESLIKNLKKDWLILRCNGLIGQYMTKGPLFDLLNNKKIWIHKDSRLQLISTIDIAKIINLLINKKIKNQIFNISSKKNINMNSLKKLTKSKSKLSAKGKLNNYNINIEKISKLYKLPTTKESIKELLKNL